MTGTIKSKEELRSSALSYCSDFIADWDRVSSIVNLMEEAFNVEIKEAENDTIEAYAAEQLSLNLYWLRQQLFESAKQARERLEAVGYSTGPRA